MRVLSFALLTAALLAAAPAVAAKKDVISWGKAGVSFNDYRTDAVTCGRQGYYLDIAATEQVDTFRKASKQIDANEAAMGSTAMTGDIDRAVMIAGNSARIVENTRPSQRIKALRKMMDEAVATCLTQHGYTRFRLTETQKDQLGRLKDGTAERHAYLYSLARDPQIVSGQAI